MRTKPTWRLSVSCCAVLFAVASFGCGSTKNASSRAQFLAPQAPQTQPSRQSTSPVIGNLSLKDNANISPGRPTSGGAAEILISRDEYVISWNRDHRAPNWVEWQLSDASFGTIHRRNSFAIDPDLDTYLSSNDRGVAAVEPDEFRGSCFDRGHQIPSADRTGSAAANDMTFLMSNMLPQTAYLNRVIWEHLENHERTLVKGTDKTVFIVAGPIYKGVTNHIGPHQDIDVPTANFKIVFADGQVLAAVIMPNTTSTGSDPIEDHTQACDDSTGHSASPNAGHADDWEAYRSSVEQIASASGFDFSFLQ